MAKTPSIKLNIIANYASNAFVTAISIVIVPIYIRYLGLEVYGLIGVFMMLQSWFSLLDFGLSTTMMREAARSRAGASSSRELRQLLVTLEALFCIIAIAVGLILVAASGWIASDWLKVGTMDLSTVRRAIILMAPTIAFRFVSTLYRSVVTGFEELIWLGGFNACIALLRFALVVPLFEIFGASSDLFFGVQLGVAALEWGILACRAHRSTDSVERPPIDFRALRSVMGFSLAAGISGILWVVVTQFDKLVLSTLLPLGQYAIFSVVALVANGIFLVSSPITAALIPRLMKLHAAGDEEPFVALYRRATQFTAFIVVPLAVTLALFSREALWVWTGNAGVTQGGAAVLSLYVTGTAILTLSGFVAYLQYARGNIRMHIIGSLLFLMILAPLVFWLAGKYGAFGAGCAWLFVNALYLAVWVPLIHFKFLPGIHLHWMGDVGAILVSVLVVGVSLHLILEFPASRVISGLILVLVGSALSVVAGAASPWIRGAVSANVVKVWKRVLWV